MKISLFNRNEFFAISNFPLSQTKIQYLLSAVDRTPVMLLIFRFSSSYIPLMPEVFSLASGEEHQSEWSANIEKKTVWHPG